MIPSPMHETIKRLRHPRNWYAVFQNYVAGAHWHHVVHNMVEDIAAHVDRALAAAGHTLRVACNYPKPNSKKINGLILYHDGQTALVPLVVSRTLLKVGKRPVYLGHDKGPMLLANAILDQVEDFSSQLAASDEDA